MPLLWSLILHLYAVTSVVKCEVTLNHLTEHLRRDQKQTSARSDRAQQLARVECPMFAKDPLAGLTSQYPQT